jgi:arsenate reductase
MAEAWLNHLYGDRFEAHSAGLAAEKLSPLAVEAMKEADIDISHKKCRRFSTSSARGGYFFT